MIVDFNEVWLPVKGFEGHYEVSNLGRVVSVARKVAHPRGDLTLPRKLLRQRSLKTRQGHKIITLRKDGAYHHVLVHRLVLTAFVGVCPEGMEACHNDGDGQNNRLDNLRWGTRRDNLLDRIKHGQIRKLALGDAEKIRTLYASGRYAQWQIGEMFGINQRMVSNIVLGKAWRW